MTTNVKNALVICTRRIGDVLLATPVVEALTAEYPGLAVDMLVFAGTESVIASWSTLNRVWTIPERPSKQEHRQLLRALWRRYDLAVSVLPGDRPTWYAWIAGRYRIGTLLPDRKSFWKRLLLHRWVPFDNYATHTVVMNCQVLPSGTAKAIPTPAVTWSPEDEATVHRHCAFLKETIPLAVLHVTPKFRYKAWTVSGWVALIRWLHARGLRVAMTGGSSPAERAIVNELARAVPNLAVLIPTMSLSQIAYLLSRACIYVGTDTGVSHMAAALGVPSVVLFGPSNPVKWGPWPCDYAGMEASPWQSLGSQRQGNVYLLQGVAPCVPCLQEGCDRHPDSDSQCLQQLPAQRVIQAVRIMLEESQEWMGLVSDGSNDTNRE